MKIKRSAKIAIDNIKNQKINKIEMEVRMKWDEGFPHEK